MAEGLHLLPRHREDIEALLHKHLPGVEVWAYGSRVNGRSHDGSDLDLVLRGPKLAEIDISRLADFIEALQDSTIPFLVEARDWARLPESFHHEVEREHVALVEREESLGTASDGWVSLSLGEVCTKIGSGATPRGGKEVYLKDGPYALIRSQNVYNHRFNHDGLAFINQHQATELNNVEVFADDVLLNITGDSVARACQVAPDVLPARVNQHVAIIRPDPHKLSPHFLRYFLVCPEIQAMLLSWAGSGGTRNALTKGMIESFDVQVPMDVDEQRAIAHILGTLDDKIELNRRMNETLEAMARALFKSWFIDFDPVRAKMAGRDPGLPQDLADLFPDRLVESELGEIPEGWEVAPFSECVEVVRGLSYKGSGLSSDGVPMHNLNSIYEGGGYKHDGIKSYDGEHKSQHVARAGDLIVANTEQGHGRLLIGYAAIVPTSFVNETLFSHHLYRVRPKDCTALTSNYLCQLLNTRVMHEIVSGFANGTTVNMLPMDAFQTPQIAVPARPVLAAFNDLAEAARRRHEEMIDESRTLAALRDTLLPKLVSGEVRVTLNRNELC